MSTAKARNEGLYNLAGVNLPTQQDQTTFEVVESLDAHVTQAQARPTPQTAKGPTFLGNIEKVLKVSKQRAVTRCLNSVTGGNKSPWKAYPGHNKLVTLDMDLNGKHEADQFHSSSRENSEIKDWLEWRIQPESEDAGRRSSKGRLKLLLVTLAGGETVSSSADEDANALHGVFDEWGFPTSSLSILLDRRATFMDQHTAINATKRPSGRSVRQTNRVFCIGMRQWCMVWSPSPYDPPFGARGVVMCLDKTWASSVPGVIQQYLKTMWMFVEFEGILPLIACMTSLRYAASALAEDDKEAFRREFELRSWLKGGLNTERKDLGYTSAQVSWLSSRVSRHRDRLMVTNRMLGILKETLDIYEIFAPTDSFEILRNCICNLADMKEHLRSQARQLEAQANVQLAALFNLITQKDSATALIIAKTSQTIAADSRRDQKVSVDIANSSRLIAYNTLRDSASMKAIANVTMIFLPGTFMASVFAMPFFSSQTAVGFFVNSKIWIYVVITIPLTLITLSCAWVWYRFSARSHQALNGKDAEEDRTLLTGGIMNGGVSWMDTNLGQMPMLSPAEKNIGSLAYAQEEQQLDDSLQADMEFEDQDYNANNFKHWDPMTREFAPSVFAASSFAFTEDSDAAMSIRSIMASAGSEPPVFKPTEVVESTKPDPNSSEIILTGLTDRNASKLKKKAAEAKARVVERKKQRSRDRDAERAKKLSRRVWVEDDDSDLEVVVKPTMPSRPTRRASPDGIAFSLSTTMPSRRSTSKPTTPTKGSYLKHAETPDSARDRDQNAPGMTRSYSDEVSRRPQSGRPRGSRIEQPRQVYSASRTKYQIVEPEYSDYTRPRLYGEGGLHRRFQSPEMQSERPELSRQAEKPQSSKKAQDMDAERGRDQYWSTNKARSRSGDSFKSWGSGHSHKGYSY